MRTAGVREAQHDVASLLHDVCKGEEIVIADHGRPVARRVPGWPKRGWSDLDQVRKTTRGRVLALTQTVDAEAAAPVTCDARLAEAGGSSE